MMNIKKVDKIVLLLIFLTLIVGMFTVYQRVLIEKEYKTAEIILDYPEMENLTKIQMKIKLLVIKIQRNMV